MNEDDKKAFDWWWHREADHTTVKPSETWRAACEYKNKELSQYKEAARSEAEEVNRLQAENKKLREALEFYTDLNSWLERIEEIL